MHAPEQKKKRSGTTKVLMGCGIVSLLLVVTVVGCGVWMWSSVIKDPAELAALSQEMLPGVEIPDGYEGFMGWDKFGLQGALFGPPGMDDVDDKKSMFVIARFAEDSGAEMEAQVEQQAGQGDGTSEDLDSETITVGGNEVEFKKKRVTQDGRKTLQIIGILPASDGRVVMLMFMGPEETFDRPAMDALLASIPATAATPEQGPDGE